MWSPTGHPAPAPAGLAAGRLTMESLRQEKRFYSGGLLSSVEGVVALKFDLLIFEWG